MSRLNARIQALEGIARPVDVAERAAAHVLAVLRATDEYLPTPPLPDGVTQADIRKTLVDGLRQLEARTCAA